MTLDIERLRELLAPFVPEGASAVLGDALLQQLRTYLDLLLRWNARTNLTAIRDPEAIVQRHFGESLFLALRVRPLLANNASVLDFGSGPGFPGLPLQMLYPELRVTLAESQGKKASFLREAARVLEIRAEVWGSRVEDMPESRQFDAVTMRAVDDPASSLAEAEQRLCPAGILALLTSDGPPRKDQVRRLLLSRATIPLSTSRWLELYGGIVPRGT